MDFKEFIKKQGISYSDFKAPEDMEELINKYAKQYLCMYYGV